MDSKKPFWTASALLWMNAKGASACLVAVAASTFWIVRLPAAHARSRPSAASDVASGPVHMGQTSESTFPWQPSGKTPR